ncbi:MAG: hypothetical protein K2Z81_12160, partial [Cyanobacteria bacterium]|nr:hypothetical protein [Cyanobacteriota bacterium]
VSKLLWPDDFVFFFFECCRFFFCVLLARFANRTRFVFPLAEARASGAVVNSHTIVEIIKRASDIRIRPASTATPQLYRQIKQARLSANGGLS